MKRVIKVCLFLGVIFYIFLLSSCFDFIQTIKFDENGYSCYYKFILSKSAIELSGENQDDIMEEIKSFSESLPVGSDFLLINNSNDFGFQFRFNINSYTSSTDAENYQPYLSEDESEFLIPFALGQNTDIFDHFYKSNKTAQGIVDYLLCSSKCKILISKTIIENFTKMYFHGLEENMEIQVYDFGDYWCAEIPLINFKQKDNFDFSVIAVQI